MSLKLEVMFPRILIFLILNFAALGIGAYFTNTGVVSHWYGSLEKAPWTPPGWVFGAAWTILMFCFSIYMAYATVVVRSKTLIAAYCIQWFFNVLWNPVFFYFHNISGGLILIVALTVLVFYMYFHYLPYLRKKSLWLLPYMAWLLVATSLNAYIFFFN